MIQFNLLPDVKLEYIKTQRTKRFVMAISLIASAASLAVFVLLVLTVDFWQNKTIDDLSDDIKKSSNTLKAQPNLDKILTVQSQLGSLGSLHEQKPAAQRLFGYLTQLTPSKASITDITADFVEGTVSVTGKTPSLDVVNTFTDSLKFTKYQVAGSSEKNSAFSSVVLSSFGRTKEGATYTITFSFKAGTDGIFGNKNDISLVVPKITSTRSSTEQPATLFDGTTTPNKEQQ